MIGKSMPSGFKAMKTIVATPIIKYPNEERARQLNSLNDGKGIEETIKEPKPKAKTSDNGRIVMNESSVGQPVEF